MHGLMRKTSTIYLVAGLLSLMLSCWLSVRESVINPDAICYLQSAADMKFGLQAAMHLCGQAKWPFYSILIYAFHSVFGLSLESVAYLLDGLLSLVSVLTFIAIIRFITDKPRVLWFAAAVILLAHEFNSVRQYIIRDHGFWAFYLLSIYLLLHYFSRQSWCNAIAWSASIILATLFRVEGAIFLLTIPLLSLLDTRNRFALRLKGFIQLNTVTLIGLGVVGACAVLQFHFELSRLQEVQDHLFYGLETIFHHFSALKQSLAQHVLTHDSEHEAGAILFVMMFGWYFYSIIVNISLIYAVLVIYACLKKSMRGQGFVYLVLCGYVIVNVLITASFLVENLFLSKRYLIGLSLVLMIWVPFALNALYEQAYLKKWPVIAACFFIVLSSLGGIFDFGYSKKYIHDAGDWLALNTPKNAVIYSNDFQLMYYSHRFGDHLFDKAKDYIEPQAIANGKWKQYDYLAMRVNQNSSKSDVNDIKYALVQVFSNKRGDQVRIYRRG